MGKASLMQQVQALVICTLVHCAWCSVIVPLHPLQMRPMRMTMKENSLLKSPNLSDPIVRILLRTWRPFHPRNIVGPPKMARIPRNNECAAGSNSLPMIYVRGTNYQVGFEMGRIMREHIQSFYANFEPLHHLFLPFLKTEKGQHVYDGYLNVVRDHLPQYFEEIRGISEGSGVPIEQVFAMHIRSELALLLRQGHYETPACTTVFVHRPEAEIIGHNEDNDPGLKAHSYLVSAEILSENGTTVEQFTAFAYPGVLPGNAFSFNRAGVIFTANSESPITVPTDKIPRYVMNRALMAAENPEDVERIISMEPGLSQGCSLNVIFTKDPSDPIKMRNYELLGSFDQQISTIIDRTAVLRYDPDKPSVEGNGFLYHFNKYERIKVKQNPENIVSSIHRQTRASQLPVPESAHDVLQFLGDTTDADYPVFRTPNEKDGGCTIATALFDLKAMTMSVYRDNPRTSSPLLVSPIPK